MAICPSISVAIANLIGVSSEDSFVTSAITHVIFPFETKHAQRRFVQIKSVDDNLDLGHGLTVAAYTQLIEINRAALGAHNTLLSSLDESRKTITQLDKALSEFSERMLSGVGSVYGRSSIEYVKTSSSSRKQSKTSSSTSSVKATTVTQSTQPTLSPESASSNGKVTTAY